MVGLLDLIPVIVFFIAFKQFGVYGGATGLLVSTFAVYLIHLVKQKGKLSKQQWIVLVLTVVFCGLTLALHDDFFIKIKSPIINGIFAATLFISALLKKPIIKPLLSQAFVLSDTGWLKLAVAWGYYFLIMAILHYYFGFKLPFDTIKNNEIWVDFKTWGQYLVLIPFMVLQFLFLKNHLNPELETQLNKK